MRSWPSQKKSKTGSRSILTSLRSHRHSRTSIDWSLSLKMPVIWKFWICLKIRRLSSRTLKTTLKTKFKIEINFYMMLREQWKLWKSKIKILKENINFSKSKPTSLSKSLISIINCQSSRLSSQNLTMSFWKIWLRSKSSW